MPDLSSMPCAWQVRAPCLPRAQHTPRTHTTTTTKGNAKRE